MFSHNFVRTSYNRIFRRNSTFVTSILVGAIGAEIFFDGVTNWVYGSLNRGVRPVVREAYVFIPSEAGLATMSSGPNASAEVLGGP